MESIQSEITCSYILELFQVFLRLERVISIPLPLETLIKDRYNTYKTYIAYRNILREARVGGKRLVFKENEVIYTLELLDIDILLLHSIL